MVRRGLVSSGDDPDRPQPSVAKRESLNELKIVRRAGGTDDPTLMTEQHDGIALRQDVLDRWGLLFDRIEVVGNGAPDFCKPTSLSHSGELGRGKDLQLEVRMGIRQCGVQITSRNRIDLCLHGEKLSGLPSAVPGVGRLRSRFAQPAW